MTEAERLAHLEVRVSALNMELGMLKALLDSQSAVHAQCHAQRRYHDGLVAGVITKAADLLGRVLLADPALVPDDIMRSALELHAVWNEASA